MTINDLNSLIEAGANTRVYRLNYDPRRDTATLEEQRINNSVAATISEEQIPYPRDSRGRMTVDPDRAVLTEASTGAGTTANFPDLLRMGVMFDAFSGYNEAPVTWPLFAREVGSNKMQEEYLRDAGVGLLPVVPEGTEYPRVGMSLDGGTIIRNYKYGMILPVTEELRRFDQLGKVRDVANLLGRAGRLTEEQLVMNVASTATNYTRNSTTADNDTGANQANTTFGPAGLITAFTTLTTMKDRKTGAYLGVQPDTLLIGPLLWYFCRQLLQSPQSMRVGDPGSAHEVYGNGTTNPFYQFVRNIIVSPLFGASYGWSLMEARRAIYLQRVDPLTVDAPVFNHKDDSYDYRVRNWFGVGMKDDRFAFLSTSTTAPTGA